MREIYHDPENKHPIGELWAWVSIDPKGNEGILGGFIGTTAFTLVTGEERIAKGMMRDAALKLVGKSDKKIRLVKFAAVEILESL